MSDYIDRQAALNAINIEREYMTRRQEWGAEHILTHYGYRIIADMPSADVEPVRRWIPCTQPPQDERNVFLAHGTNNFKSCCIGHYEHDVKMWYEDRNWFATPIYDCKYWCDIPELPDMDGDIDG